MGSFKAHGKRQLQTFKENVKFLYKQQYHIQYEWMPSVHLITSIGMNGRTLCYCFAATNPPSQFLTSQIWTSLPCTSVMPHKLVHISTPTPHGNHRNGCQQQYAVQSTDVCLLLPRQQHSSRGRTEKLGHVFPITKCWKTNVWQENICPDPIITAKIWDETIQSDVFLCLFSNTDAKHWSYKIKHKEQTRFFI